MTHTHTASCGELTLSFVHRIDIAVYNVLKYVNKAGASHEAAAVSTMDHSLPLIAGSTQPKIA
jgi:hypothetical protein